MAPSEKQNVTMREQDPDESFVFVLPLRNLEDSKVTDPGQLFALLKRTIESLLSQKYPAIHVVVVCNQVPDWANTMPANVHFLDVSGNEVFVTDRNVFLDIGQRYVIGALYAYSCLNPRYVMLMDADDYVNVRLARKLMNRNTAEDGVGAYVLRKGVEVILECRRNHDIYYRSAYVVQRFDAKCGSCRVLRVDTLINWLESMQSGLAERFSAWSPSDSGNRIRVSREAIEWFAHNTRRTRERKLVRFLGNHTKLKKLFTVTNIAGFAGAAKAVGHDSHDGRGVVHWDGVEKRIPMKEFLQQFGLSEEYCCKRSLRGWFDDAQWTHELLRRKRKKFSRRAP